MRPHDSTRPLLSVRRLRVYFRRRRWLRHSLTVKAIDDIHFDLRAGDTLAVVGEAGSGKSTLVSALLGQVTVTAGSIVYGGHERVGLASHKLRDAAASLCGVVQSPIDTFGRRIRVDRLLSKEIAAVLPKQTAAARLSRITDLLARVGLDSSMASQRLGSLEPAARARVMLAAALLTDPQLLICDGPIDELDADARIDFLGLVAQLQAVQGFSLILTARDFGDVIRFARRILVLTLGHIVEQGPAEVVVRTPAHPYSRRLLQLAADASGYDGNADPAHDIPAALPDDLPERMPTAENPPMGCVFHTRCGLAERICVQSIPTLRRTVGIDHYAACHFAPVAD
jgi:oligopeptide transport system ATP-binding protein